MARGMLFGIALLAAAPALGAEPDPLAHLRKSEGGVRIAVLDFQAKGTDPERAAALGEVAAASVAGIEGARVTTRADIKNLLGFEQEKQLLGCGDENSSCLAEIGGALGVDYLLSGTLSDLAGTTVITMQLVDAKSARSVNRVSSSWQGDASELPALVQALAVQTVAGPAAKRMRGKAEIVVSVAGAKVYVDGESVGDSPLIGALPLGIGKHDLRVTRAEFVTHAAPFVVLPDETRLITVRLRSEAESNPWFTQWWVWAAGGAVLLGGAAAVAAVAVSGSSGSGTFTVPGPAGIP